MRRSSTGWLICSGRMRSATKDCSVESEPASAVLERNTVIQLGLATRGTGGRSCTNSSRSLILTDLRVHEL